MPPPWVNPAISRRKTRFASVPTRMNGRRRPNRLPARSERAPESGVTKTDSDAPSGGISPLNSSLRWSPTIAVIWLGRTMASRAPQWKL